LSQGRLESLSGDTAATAALAEQLQQLQAMQQQTQDALAAKNAELQQLQVRSHAGVFASAPPSGLRLAAQVLLAEADAGLTERDGQISALQVRLFLFCRLGSRIEPDYRRGGLSLLRNSRPTPLKRPSFNSSFL